MRQNCGTLKAATFAETSRSKNVAASVIKTIQLFNCQSDYIIYLMLAYERLCTKTVSVIHCNTVEAHSRHRK